mmetsp:Transcript_10564/g.15548  ORF Transcript_10564/g.15548 Transcript_10564/m.15548 type:complete len:156 (+) Transcript_10564:43-510(+)
MSINCILLSCTMPKIWRSGDHRSRSRYVTRQTRDAQDMKNVMGRFDERIADLEVQMRKMNNSMNRTATKLNAIHDERHRDQQRANAKKESSSGGKRNRSTNDGGKGSGTSQEADTSNHRANCFPCCAKKGRNRWSNEPETADDATFFSVESSIAC